MKRFAPFLASLVPLLCAAHAAAASPGPNVDAYHAAGPALLPPARGALAPAFVSGKDEQRGVPTFLWAMRGPGVPQPSALASMTPEQAARAHLAIHAPRYGLTPAALSTAVVARVLDTGRGGITVVLRQRVGGVDLFHSDVKVLMDRGLGLVAIGGNLHAAAVPSPKTRGFLRSAPEALAAALGDLHGLSLDPADLVDIKLRKGDYAYFTLVPGKAAGAVRLVEPARVKPVWFPLPDRIVPAHFVEVISQASPGAPPDAFAYVFAADDGRLLYREDLTHADTFTYRVWADPTGDKRPADGPLARFNPHPTGTPDGTYPVPVAPVLIGIDGFDKTMDPWLPSGATQTQGNAVDAYTDDNKPEGFSGSDTRALTTSTGVFDHTYDVSQGPQANLEQRQAAVTDMFYVTNWLHDWWYDSGFDEKGGNAQKDNLGRGGLAGDPLLAEGQFQSPTLRNNSNMSVPGDGMSPRMHMYVWDGVGSSSLTVQPGNLSPMVGLAAFGPQTFNVSGAVVLAVDGAAPDVNDACEALTNGAAVAGNIALLNRGTCSFKQKVVNAQAAGAIGVILVDNVPNEAAPQMGNTGSITTQVTIPVLSVSLTDGTAIKGIAGAMATLKRASAPDRDGTIDNSVIAHEWGHYLHLRHVACSQQQCQAHSEGWADFDAMMMTVRSGDDLNGTWAMGQYAVAAFPDDPGYFGIRRYPYSTNLAKSPLTFKYISDGVALPSGIPYAKGNAVSPNSEVHAAGEIWAAMLFEGYAAMLAQSKLPAPPYTFDQARRRMSDYVVGGLTLAPADPTYTEQRDAILAAAAAADPGDLTILAKGFAKRGAGTCAVSPARDSTDFSGVVESFTIGPNLTLTQVTVDDSVSSCDGHDGYLDAGEKGKVTVHVINAGPAPLPGATATVKSVTPGVSFPGGTTVAFGDIGALTSAVGSIDIALEASFTGKKNLDLQVTLDASTGCAATVLPVSPPINVDEVPASSKVDDVEPKATVWTTSGDMADKIWARAENVPGNHVWAGTDYGAPSDTALVSPELQVSATEHLVLSFTHRHSFEQGMNVNWDGGVIEVSTDGGKTWGDVTAYGMPGYGGTIGDPSNMAMNVLKGRQGFVGQNTSWPSTDKVSIDLGTTLAGMMVQIRFRIGTDDASGDVGWELDDIGFSGIDNTPFAALVEDTEPCVSSSSSSGGMGGATSSGGATGGAGTGGNGSGGGHLYASGGCGCRTAEGGDPKALAAAIMALAAVVVRGRRRRCVS